MKQNNIREILRFVFKEKYVSDDEIDEMVSEIDPSRSGFACKEDA